jgi:NtrC-family two-component system sensor histidine kinase KinB
MVWVLGVLLGWIGLLLAYWGVRRTRSPQARLWALALLALALWTWSESLIIGAPDAELRILGFRIQALGVAGIAPFFLLGALRYSGLRARPWHRISILLIPVLTVLLAFTNDAHRLVWSTLAIQADGSLVVSYGPWFWAHTLFASLAFLGAVILLLPTLIHTYRVSFRILAGFLLAIALVTVSVLIGLHDPSYDQLPAAWRGAPAIALGLATVLLGLIFRALPRIRPIPLARGLLIKGMADGMMVLDLRGRVIDLNPRMAELLGRPPSACLDTPAEDLLAAWPELRDVLCAAVREGGERSVELRHPAQERWFLFSIQPISSREEHEGWLVRASEITEHRRQALRRARQQEALLQLARDPQIQNGELEEAIARIAWTAAETLQVSRVNVWQLDAATHRLCCLIHVEWPEGRVGKEADLQADEFPAYLRALQEERAVDASDAWNDPRTRALRERYMAPRDIRSTLDAPIRQGGQVVGVIRHEHTGEIRAWTADEMSFAAEVADLIALVWSNAERRAAEARAQRYARQLQLLQGISQEICRAADLECLYALTLRGMRMVLGADRAAVLVRDPDGVARFKAWENLSEGYRCAVEGHWPWDPSDPNPTILWIPDTAQSPELGNVQETALREGIRAIAFVPIRSEGQTVGNLMLYYDAPRHPDEDTLRLAETLASAVGTALRRRRETGLWEAMAGALQEILSAPPEFPERVRTILQGAKRLLGGDRAGIWFYEPIREQGTCAGADGLSPDYVQWILESHRHVPGVRAIETPTIIHIPDVQADPRTQAVRERLLQEGFRAYVVFPLWAPAMTASQFPFRGVLSVYWDTVRTLTAEELFLGQAFANAAAQALASAYLFEETRRHARYEAALHQMAAAILQAEELEGILRAGLEHARMTTGLRMGEVYLWEDSPGCLRLRAAVGLSPEDQALLTECLPGEGLAGQVFTEARILVYGDLRLGTPERELPLPLHAMRAWIGVPLRAGPRPVGVLSLHDPQPHMFTDQEIQMLETLADHLALAVERAALVERLATQVQETSLLYEASANLLAAQGVGPVLTLLGRLLCDITRGSYARFYRYRSESGTLETLMEFTAPDAVRQGPPGWLEGPREDSLAVRAAVLRERRPIALRLADPEAERLLPGEDREALARLGVRRLMILPLAVGARVLGLAEVWDPIGESPFSLNQIAMSQAIANHAAVALENARLLEDLRAERSRLRTLIDAAVDGIVLIRAGGEIVEINRAATRLLSLDEAPQSWVGRSVIDLLCCLKRRRPELAQGLVRYLRAWRRSPESRPTVELEASPYALQVRGVLIAEGPSIMGWLLWIYDVTPLRELERLREEFLHMIVHDLRTPAASIQTALDFLLSESVGPLVPEQRDVLTIARDNVGRMLRMINAILDLRQLQSGQAILQLRPLSLTELVAGILKELSILIREKGLKVLVEIPSDLPPVHVDEMLVSRVFQNLVDNAIKFTPSGRTIWIRATVEDARAVRVEIADSGPGVPLELRERLFQPFVTGMVRGRGFGLGLAFCKLAVEAHGGRIWVEDQPGSGALFVFTLPLVLSSSENGGPDYS